MIGLDSWIFLEFFSMTDKWLKCKKILESKEKKVISPIVLMEIKFKGTKKFGEKKTSEILRKIKESKSIVIFNLNKTIAELAADLRLKYYDKKAKPVSYADMINLATSIMTKCKIFYSGDPDFEGIKEIKTVII